MVGGYDLRARIHRHRRALRCRQSKFLGVAEGEGRKGSTKERNKKTMMPARYKTTKEGNVITIATNELMQVKRFTVGRNGGVDVVALYLKDGSLKTIVRHLIDEEAFQFGIASTNGKTSPQRSTQKTAARTEKCVFVKRGKPLVGVGPAVTGGSITLTAEELMTILLPPSGSVWRKVMDALRQGAR